MADDARTRQQRRRAHTRGDHSMCTPGRCDALLGGAVELAALVASPPLRVAGDPRAECGSTPKQVAPAGSQRQPGGIETAVAAFVAALPFREPDPRALLALIAVRLARRVDESGALPAAVRELRVLLSQLVEVPSGPSGVVDEIRLRAAQRQLDVILRTQAA